MIFDRILKVKKTKFAENSALSFTFWSKRASSSSLEAIIKWRRPGAAKEFCHHFSGRFPAKIDEECRPVEFFCLKWLYLDTMRGDESRKSQSDAWFFLVGSCYDINSAAKRDQLKFANFGLFLWWKLEITHEL